MSEDDDESHVSVGGLVARHWNFPAALSEVLSYHHAPGKSPGDSPLVSIVHVADIMVHMVGFTTFTDEIAPKIDGFSLDVIKMQPEHLRVIASETLHNEKAVESFINFLFKKGLCGPFCAAGPETTAKYTPVLVARLHESRPSHRMVAAFMGSVRTVLPKPSIITILPDA